MDKEFLKVLFERLLYIRHVEERIAQLYPEQEMRCPVHLSIGQEATAVGAISALSLQDMVFSNHRAHGHYLAKGGNLQKFFAEIYGKETGCSRGRGGSMHLIDLDVNFMGSTPIVGNIIPVAMGAAFTASFKKSDQVVMVFLGDAASEEGVFHECLNFSKLRNLPIIFFCENNFYSVYTPLNERQPARKIIDIARAHGLSCFEVDGNDVLKVYEITKQAVEKIKMGSGPVFIESPTYRWREHCGPNYDNHIGYRKESEFMEWKQKCPLERLQRKLIEEGIMAIEEISDLNKRIATQIETAVDYAKSSQFPSKEELDKFVYAK